MRVAPHYILVSINKKDRKERQEKLSSGIYLSPTFIYASRNLQYGEVLQVGKQAAKHFPEAQPGDIALFHHLVEDPDNDPERLVHDDLLGDYEHRVLKAVNDDGTLIDYDIFGFIKPDGTLIACNNHIFVSTDVRPYLKRTTSEVLITNDGPATMEDLDKREALLMKHLDQMTRRCEQLKATLQTRETESAARDIVMVLDGLYADRWKTTQELNRARLIIGKVFSISKSERELNNLSSGDEIMIERKEYLYAIDVKDKSFYVVKSQFAVCKLEN